MVKLKVTTVGSSTGLVLPKEVLARLKIDKGFDSFFSLSALKGREGIFIQSPTSYP